MHRCGSSELTSLGVGACTCTCASSCSSSRYSSGGATNSSKRRFNRRRLCCRCRDRVKVSDSGPRLLFHVSKMPVRRDCIDRRVLILAVHFGAQMQFAVHTSVREKHHSGSRVWFFVKATEPYSLNARPRSRSVSTGEPLHDLLSLRQSDSFPSPRNPFDLERRQQRLQVLHDDGSLKWSVLCDHAADSLRYEIERFDHFGLDCLLVQPHFEFHVFDCATTFHGMCVAVLHVQCLACIRRIH